MEYEEKTKNEAEAAGSADRFISLASTTTDGFVGARVGLGAMRNFSRRLSDNVIFYSFYHRK